jgi:hypothetical protein
MSPVELLDFVTKLPVLPEYTISVRARDELDWARADLKVLCSAIEGLELGSKDDEFAFQRAAETVLERIDRVRNMIDEENKHLYAEVVPENVT